MLAANLVNDYTECQDGLVLVTQQGNVIFDARYLSDGSACLYVVETYTRISEWPGELMNISYLGEYADEDYELSNTMMFEDRPSMMNYLAEQMLSNHF